MTFHLLPSASSGHPRMSDRLVVTEEVFVTLCANPLAGEWIALKTFEVRVDGLDLSGVGQGGGDRQFCRGVRRRCIHTRGISRRTTIEMSEVNKGGRSVFTWGRTEEQISPQLAQLGLPTVGQESLVSCGAPSGQRSGRQVEPYYRVSGLAHF